MQARINNSKLLNEVYLRNLFITLNSLKSSCDEQGKSVFNTALARLEDSYGKALLNNQVLKVGCYYVFPTDFYSRRDHKRLYCCMLPHVPPHDKPDQRMMFFGWYTLGDGPLMNQKKIPGVSDKRSLLESAKRIFGIAA